MEMTVSMRDLFQGGYLLPVLAVVAVVEKGSGIWPPYIEEGQGFLDSEQRTTRLLSTIRHEGPDAEQLFACESVPRAVAPPLEGRLAAESFNAEPVEPEPRVLPGRNHQV